MTRNFFKTIYHNFSSMKLIQKLVISYFILIILPLGLISFMFYNKATQIVENNITFAANQGLDQAEYSLSYKLYNIFKDSNVIILNDQISNILTKNLNNYDIIDQLQDMYVLQKTITPLEDNENICNIRLYLPDSLMYSSENRNLFSISKVQNKKWYKTLGEMDSSFFWAPSSYLENNFKNGQSGSANEEELLSLTRVIYNPKKLSERIGAVRFDFYKERIVELVKKSIIQKNSYFYIQNSMGDMIAQSQNEIPEKYKINTNQIKQLPPKITPYVFGNEEVLAASRHVENTDWYLLSVIPYNEIFSESREIRRDIFILMLVVGTSAFFIAYIISYSITKRLTILTRKMRGMHSGNLVTINMPLSNDEIGELMKDFNFMIKEMTGLIEEKFKSGQALKSAELKALQAQINPHFLYNTLDIISWLAVKNSGNKIVKIVDSLAKFYKLSLSKGNDVITIKDELIHVTSYFQIQSFRFKDAFHLLIDVDESIMEYSILKITLQPIVENAIQHGILGKPCHNGLITITGTMDKDCIVLKVQDDGVGIPEEKLPKILTEQIESKGGSGFGLKNINERVKLFYGSKYGLSFKSILNTGTTVEIKIPAIKP